MGINMQWLEQYLVDRNGFPRPNWEGIYKEVERNYQDCDQHRLWDDIANSWMKRFCSALSSGYRVHETENFLLLTSESDKYVALLCEFLERTLKRILTMLHGIAADNGYGKHIVVIFDDIDMYYAYLSDFYSLDGEYGLSAGVYLNRGYGHFALPHQELSYTEQIVAHELTHALLVHLPIPAWLNEGMAVGVEHLVTGLNPLVMDEEMYGKHQAFWNEEEIQSFWSGGAFNRADEAQELSYHLARFMVNSLSQDYETFIVFANKANWEDSGEAAAQETYGASLGNLITQYFGEADWAPNPTLWK